MGPSLGKDERELEWESVEDSKSSSVFLDEVQQRMAQRWRSRLEHNKVTSTGNSKNLFINRRDPDSRNATHLHEHAHAKGYKLSLRAILTERLRNIRELKQ